MTQVFRLDDVRLDGGTQVRVELNHDLVAEYARRMQDGDEFPPIVLFFDGSAYHLADGFHRCLARRRAGHDDILGEVRDGSRADALWFALGANKGNGARLTSADKKRAVVIAIEQWPTRSQREVARHVGCDQAYVQRIRAELMTCRQLPDAVVGKDGKTYPVSDAAKAKHREAIAVLARAGKSTQEIRAALGFGFDLIREVRRQVLGDLPPRARNADERDARAKRMRTMADEGYTSRQIAAAVGLSTEGCSRALKRHGIHVQADRVVGKTLRHDSKRIVSQIVMDAENLTETADLVDYAALNHADIAEWLASLKQSREKLGLFIRRLMQEQGHNGEAAQPSPLENPSGADRADADTDRAGYAAAVPAGARR